MRAAASIVIGLCALSAFAHAQDTAVKSAAINGTAIDGATGMPVAGAIVTLRQLGRTAVTSRQLTDDRGRFVFMGLASDLPSVLTGERAGYAPGQYGQRAPGERTREIHLTPGQWLQDVVVPLWRPGSIEGTVLDEQREPIVNEYVRAYAVFTIAGSSFYLPSSFTRTDDRGAFRLGDLISGRYVVAALSTSMTASHEMLTAPPFVNRTNRAVTPNVAIDRSYGALVAFLARPPLFDRGAWTSYVTTYYPAAARPSDAVMIDVADGDTKSGVDVVLSPVRSFTVSGTVSAPAEALVDLNVRVLQSGTESMGLGSEIASARVRGDGRFEVAGVPPGAYSIEASRTVSEFHSGLLPTSLSPFDGLPVTELIYTRMPVDVGPPGAGLVTMSGTPVANGWWGRDSLSVIDHDVTNVAIALQPPVRVSGRVIYEQVHGGGLPLTFTLESADLRPDIGAVFVRPNAQGEFVVDGLRPGRYLVGLPDPGAIKSVRWQGQDVVRQGLDLTTTHTADNVVVTLTDNGAEISGHVRGGSRVAAPSSVVICFPADPEQWHGYGFHPQQIGTVDVDADGAYDIAGLPAGSYLLVAVPSADRGKWQDPDFLTRASRAATPITLQWGDRRTADLAVRDTGGTR